MGVPSARQKNAKDRLNYFLFNMRRPSTISMKFDISIIYTQIEVGTFDQFFSSSYQKYGHLVSPSYCVQIWQEMEPQGIILQSAEGITWIPHPICFHDKALMDIAVNHYNKKGSACINRCRQFLQVISVLDLLIPYTTVIHPSYIEGYPPLSRTSYITWPPIPRPPKNIG